MRCVDCPDLPNGTNKRQICCQRMGAMKPDVGFRVRFAPNPRFPEKLVEATVVRSRADPRRGAAKRDGKATGWLDTQDDQGVERSVRPSRVEILRAA